MSIARMEPKYRIAVLIALIIIGALTYVLYTDRANEHPLDVNLNPVLYVNWGGDSDALTYKPRAGKDGIDIGPRSFFVTSFGIYVLDNARHRICTYRNGKFERELKLLGKSEPTDMYLSDGAVYLLTQFSLEKIALDGSRIAENRAIRNTEALTYGVGRVFVYKNFVVVIADETSKGSSNGCFSTTDLKAVPCTDLSAAFNDYNVVDVSDDLIFVLLDDGTLGYLKNGVAARMPNAPRLKSLINPVRYPTATSYRIWHNKLYVSKQEKDGMGIYEQALEFHKQDEQIRGPLHPPGTAAGNKVSANR